MVADDVKDSGAEVKWWPQLDPTQEAGGGTEETSAQHNGIPTILTSKLTQSAKDSVRNN